MLTILDKISKKIDIRYLLMQGSLGVLLAVVLLAVILAIISPRFVSAYNFFSVTRSLSLWAVVGFSQMFALVVGHLNLSVGAIGGLSAIASGWVFQALNLPVWLGIGFGLAVGAACGLANGVIITKTGINPFVVTLGTSSAYTGMIYGITHAQPLSDIPSSLTYIGSGSILGGAVPILLLIMLAIAILIRLFFTYTALGRKLLATGGNKSAAQLSGIETSRVITLAHLFSGLLAGMGGLLYVARLGTAQPSIGGGWLLNSFAVPILGGTALTGGITSVLGAVFGAGLITLISNALVLLRVDIFWEEFFLGLVLLIAVGVDRARDVYAQRRYY